MRDAGPIRGVYQPGLLRGGCSFLLSIKFKFDWVSVPMHTRRGP
jgi:hypothetical protein